MPRLWTATIDAHRHEVREAILEATADLVAERGLLSVTMSAIAERTGIGRATLYKYFADVEAILLAWHERQISRHLDSLAELRDAAGTQDERLRAVLEAYARILNDSHRGQDAEVAAFLHAREEVADAQRELRALLRDLLHDAVENGSVRDDVPPDELAGFCVNALGAARTAISKGAIQRLVAVTVAGLRGT